MWNCTDLIKLLKPCGESWSFRINPHKANKSAQSSYVDILTMLL